MRDVAKVSPEETLVSLRDVASNIAQVKVWFVLAMLIGAGLGVAVGVIRPKYYEATVVVSANADDGDAGHMGGLASLASQYGGLASMAGINLSTGGRRDEAIAIIQSEYLTEKYIRDRNLLPVLYAKKWNPTSKTWNVRDPRDAPTLWKANLLFRMKIRKVVDDKKTNMVLMKITWTDPHLAAEWANDLVKLTNTQMRDKAVQESERNIAFLNQEAAKTENVDERRATYTLLQQELSKVMLARGKEDFALKMIDPAVAPEKAASLGIAAWAFIGLLSGAFLFAFAILIRTMLRSSS